MVWHGSFELIEQGREDVSERNGSMTTKYSWLVCSSDTKLFWLEPQIEV